MKDELKLELLKRDGLRLKVLKKLIEVGKRQSQVNIHTGAYMIGFCDGVSLTDKQARLIINKKLKDFPKNMLIDEMREIIGIKKPIEPNNDRLIEIKS